MNIEEKLRKAIKETRMESGITQTELASNIGMSTSFICDIEAGRKNPSIGTLALIVKELNMSLDKIFLN
ncbi:helix-turn-helix transcriptional regulator [Hathewaya histolytica]|uniref:DNA-binding protein n=1 Tax=Hathewaya histolytica TaxID=1498 RepID=A0A4U9RDT6_HATHI|nr:helix-turn-helix transcriptional regulator [Hathewaya histolytica]VTQ89924.1 DNA-binding protein [Hathewaya histolytica]